jgi:hypothetical protein
MKLRVILIKAALPVAVAAALDVGLPILRDHERRQDQPAAAEMIQGTRHLVQQQRLLGQQLINFPRAASMPRLNPRVVAQNDQALIYEQHPTALLVKRANNGNDERLGEDSTRSSSASDSPSDVTPQQPHEQLQLQTTSGGKPRKRRKGGGRPAGTPNRKRLSDDERRRRRADATKRYRAKLRAERAFAPDPAARASAAEKLKRLRSISSASSARVRAISHHMAWKRVQHVVRGDGETAMFRQLWRGKHEQEQALHQMRRWEVVGGSSGSGRAGRIADRQRAAMAAAGAASEAGEAPGLEYWRRRWIRGKRALSMLYIFAEEMARRSGALDELAGEGGLRADGEPSAAWRELEQKWPLISANWEHLGDSEEAFDDIVGRPNALGRRKEQAPQPETEESRRRGATGGHGWEDARDRGEEGGYLQMGMAAIDAMGQHAQEALAAAPTLVKGSAVRAPEVMKDFARQVQKAAVGGFPFARPGSSPLAVIGRIPPRP